jgi:hypothetical protein
MIWAVRVVKVIIIVPAKAIELLHLLAMLPHDKIEAP